MEPFRTFDDFWPFYVCAHSRRSTRVLHLLGTLSVVPVLVLAVLIHPGCLLLIPLVGYGFAWASHLLIEKNRPATFKHPVWSLMGELKMVGLMCTGKMNAELARCRQVQAAPGNEDVA